MKKPSLPTIALLVSAVIWGIAPPIIKYTLNFVTPFVFLFFRLLIASLIILVPLYLRIKKNKPTVNEIKDYLFLGFLCTPLNLSLLFLGIRNTSAINSSLISITSPVLIILAGFLFLKEKVTKLEIIGIVLALVGTLITVVQPLLEKTFLENNTVSGNLLVLMGTFVWVFFIIISKKKKLDPFILTASSYFTGLFCMLPIFLFEKFYSSNQTTNFFALNPKAILGIVFMAVFSSIIAYFCYVYGISKVETRKAVVFTYLEPIFSIPASYLILREKPDLIFFAGAFFIVIGVILSQKKPTRKG